MPTLINRYDRILCRRTLALGATVATLMTLIVVTTDEPETTWAGRASRIGALLPVAGGLAAFLACDQARGRGEVRAHAALGVSSAAATRGAWMGGTLIGALGAASLLDGSVDLRPLFPHAVAFEETWSRRESGWFEPSRGILVDAQGTIHAFAEVATAMVREVPMASVPRAPTFFAVLLAAVAFPLWAAARGSALRRVIAVSAMGAAAVTVFHLVAAGRADGALLLAPPGLLFAEALWLHRSRA